jgi:N-formylglutamate deformylase
MTSVGGAISDDVGVARADFVLGDRDGTSCDREFTMLVYGFLRGLGYSVKINEPYKGVELVSAFSDPKEHRHSLQIEINQRLYLDEATKVAHSGYLPLKADITKLVAVLGEYAAASARDVATHCTHHDHHHGHDHHEHGHEHPSHDHGHHSHDHGHEHHHHDHKPRHHDH